MALVAAGGALGALARVAVADAVRDLAGLPLATLLVNLAGAFALGVLVGRLGDRPGTGEVPRALIGVGLLGALTTFSTFAVQLAVLPVAGAVVYAALTVAGGLALAAAGLRWGARS